MCPAKPRVAQVLHGRDTLPIAKMLEERAARHAGHRSKIGDRDGRVEAGVHVVDGALDVARSIEASERFAVGVGVRLQQSGHDELLERLYCRRAPQRDIPKVGTLEREQLRGAAAKSNAALAELGPDIQWVESFVAGDKTFCVYLAKDEAIIRKHAEISGFPATKITLIGKMIDPTNASA